MAGDPESTPHVADLERDLDRLRRGIAEVIVGQDEVVELILTGLLARGHSVLIGVPGLAKTLLVSTLARLLDLSFKRIQFTPDLMPSDITGTDVLEEDREQGTRCFRFVRGPVFANLLLADEINRTPPKTQAALLEAMQERHVTIGDRTFDLPAPFCVVATQNPVEQEGTYRLPEAQLDRFLLAVRVGYPSEEDELEIMKRGPLSQPPDRLAVLSSERIIALQDLVPGVPAGDHVFRFALRLVRSTRPEHPGAPQLTRENITLGAGPRAAQALILAARARALLCGRSHVTLDDVRALSVPVLAHRLVTNFRADAEGIDSVHIVEQLIGRVGEADTDDDELRDAS